MSASPSIAAGDSVSAVMAKVLVALVPGAVVYVWYFGWGIVVHAVIAIVFALAAEAAVLAIRRVRVSPVVGDGSAVVTACLLAFAVPPYSPWWTTAIGASFGIIVAKQLYGGLGFNPFNPAMAGYVMLLISFPTELTQWPTVGTGADLSESVRIVLRMAPGADALSGATPLDFAKTRIGLGVSLAEIQRSPVFGTFGGRGWEGLAIAFLLGGLWLAQQRVITWHIPAAVLVTLGVLAGAFHLMASDTYASPLFHLLGGAAMLGAFFIATDPVSAASSRGGRLIFGAGVGALTYIIRTWGGYPDGVAFAVLLMNASAPTIDYFTRPRVYGHGD